MHARLANAAEYARRRHLADSRHFCGNGRPMMLISRQHRV